MTEEDFKLHNNSWYAKFIKPSPIYPSPSTGFDFLLYVAARANKNLNKLQTIENKNYLNHLETSLFQPVIPGKNKIY